MGDPQSGAAVLAFLLVVGVVGLYVWSIVWAYGDAKARGKSGFLVALLVAFLSWPMGWLAWLVFRPNERIAIVSGVRGY
jgi:hypothetical protein